MRKTLISLSFSFRLRCTFSLVFILKSQLEPAGIGWNWLVFWLLHTLLFE